MALSVVLKHKESKKGSLKKCLASITHKYAMAVERISLQMIKQPVSNLFLSHSDWVKLPVHGQLNHGYLKFHPSTSKTLSNTLKVKNSSCEFHVFFTFQVF